MKVDLNFPDSPLVSADAKNLISQVELSMTFYNLRGENSDESLCSFLMPLAFICL